MENHVAHKERFTVTFGGGDADAHEIDVQTLANSLLAMKGSLEKMGVSSYGRGADVYVRVRGQFKATSFGVDLVLWCAAAATAAAPHVQTLLSSFVDLVQLFKWAKGKNVTKASKVDSSTGKVTITNGDGQQTIVFADVLNYYENANIRSEMSRVVAPLTGKAVTSISVSPESPDISEAVIDQSDAQYFIAPESEDEKENYSDMRLEIRTPHFDGRPKGWRFYDGEDDFNADIEDSGFLDDVRERKTHIAQGYELEATVRFRQYRQNGRLKVEKTVTSVKSVIPFIPTP